MHEKGIIVKNLGKDVTMQDVVREATAAAQPGDVVVLSPSCASFDMFKNYADRGEQFIASVNALQ
jgi:UDP-N-acetylmuramoylalanine--D-glutamate ligase